MAEFTTVIDSYVVRVDKAGGGIIGKSYRGLWEVIVSESATVVLDDMLETSTPKTHREVAEMALEFIDDKDEV